MYVQVLNKNVCAGFKQKMYVQVLSTKGVPLARFHMKRVCRGLTTHLCVVVVLHAGLVQIKTCLVYLFHALILECGFI